MKKQSKVKAVNNGFASWQTEDGTTMYPHRYTMEDGTEITANHKTLNPFNVGDEVEYEVKSTDKHGNPKGSVSKVQEKSYSGGSKFESKDTGVITWLSCYSSTCTLFQQSTTTFETVLNATNVAFEEAMKHSSK